MALVQPTIEQQVIIRSELNENVNTRAEDLKTIKDWLYLQPHLPKSVDDQILMTFLRGCKFSIEKTKKKLDMYFTMRTALPEVLANRDPFSKEIKLIESIIQIPPLPVITPELYRIGLFRAKTKEIPPFNPADMFKLVLMIGDIRLMEEETGVAGDVYVLDASIASANLFAKFTPSMIKKFIVCAQEAYPAKIKAVHIINTNPIVDTIINVVKPFAKEKIRNRIHVHENLESLYQYVPKECLPEEYGGFLGPIEDIFDAWVKKVESYKDWYLEQDNIKADESKRPGKPKTYDDLFGMEGSFRKLVID